MTEIGRHQALTRPASIQETRLSTGLLTELALKLIYAAAEIDATAIAHQLRPPFTTVTNRILERFDRACSADFADL